MKAKVFGIEGKEIESIDVLAGFDAICLTTGSKIPRDIPIAGRDLSGIHFAMDYLTQANKKVRGEEVVDRIDAKDKTVVSHVNIDYVNETVVYKDKDLTFSLRSLLNGSFVIHLFVIYSKQVTYSLMKWGLR